jgi:hypothetical protein
MPLLAPVTNAMAILASLKLKGFIHCGVAEA